MIARELIWHQAGNTFEGETNKSRVEHLCAVWAPMKENYRVVAAAVVAAAEIHDVCESVGFVSRRGTEKTPICACQIRISGLG